MRVYTVKVRKSSLFGEAFLGKGAYETREVSEDKLTKDMQVISIRESSKPIKREVYKPVYHAPTKQPVSIPIREKVPSSNRPVPIRDRIKNGTFKNRPKKIAPHTLAPATGYKKPFNYELYNTLRRLGRIKPKH